MPPGSVIGNDKDEDDDGSVLSLSLLDDDYEDTDNQSYSTGSLSYEQSPPATPPSLDGGFDSYMRSWTKEIESHSHRREVEELQSRQYWRNDWRINASVDRPFDIHDSSTLGVSVCGSPSSGSYSA